MKKANGILWGIVLIAVGALFALNALGVTDINIFFDGWWTLFIIVPSAIGLFKESDKTGSIIGLIIGAFLLLCAQGVIDFNLLWKLAVPAVIIIIGVKLVFGSIFNGKSAKAEEAIKANGGELKSCCAVFSGANMDFSGEEFDGADLTAVFGGVKCDLRTAVIEKDCVIKVCSVFGGIEIFLPENIKVKTNTTSLFGGVSNKHGKTESEGVPTVFISGYCLFGGVDIR